ncbi:MAG: hypothetical protein K2N34_15765 [Lachnospiraceae bacterium]|nr:hypothetical protein [Lachnospiraceae bacterium]
MEKTEIKRNLIDFILQKTEVKLTEEMVSSQDSMLNPDKGIAPRDLLMLVMEMQTFYGISLKEEDVLNNRLDYLNNMVDWIYSSIAERG